jgi:translocation and assembly module TamB
LRRWIFGALGVLLLLPIAIVATVDIALNTGAGRSYATTEINKLAGPDIKVAGLGGHFPLDVKLADVTLLDTEGTYATAHAIELRWNPLGLLHKHVDVRSLTAGALTLQRLPAPARRPQKNPAAVSISPPGAPISGISPSARSHCPRHSPAAP